MQEKNNEIAKFEYPIENNKIPLSSTVKQSRLLSFVLNQNLTFQWVKNAFRRMARGIKTLNAFKSPFNLKTRLKIMNALVLNHLLHSSITDPITQFFVASLDQQLNWTIKSYFNRSNFDSWRDLKTQLSVLPIRYLLDFKRPSYFWRLSQSLSAFRTVPLPTFTVSENKTSKSGLWSQTLYEIVWWIVGATQNTQSILMHHPNINLTRWNWSSKICLMSLADKDTKVYGDIS